MTIDLSIPRGVTRTQLLHRCHDKARELRAGISQAALAAEVDRINAARPDLFAQIERDVAATFHAARAGRKARAG